MSDQEGHAFPEIAVKTEDLPARVYEQFASLGQALSDPTRLRILNLLCQTERSVDDLAARLGHSAPNTSAHLKVLLRVRMVERRREGRRVFYALSSPRALRLWLALRDMGLDEIPAVRELMNRFADEPDLVPDLWGEELLARVQSGDVLLLDLRPPEEFASGHLPRARSIPFQELEERMEDLDPSSTIVAYCRGPFCVAAIEGVRQLRAAGFNARRLRGGVAEWLDSGALLEQEATHLPEA